MLIWTLLQLKSKYGFRRCKAVEKLVKKPNLRAIDALIVAIGDEYPPVRREAVLALGKLRDQRVIIPLVGALEDKIWYVRKAVGETLRLLGWEPTVNIEHMIYLFALEEWEQLAKLKLPIGIERLIEEARSEEELQFEWAPQALKKILKTCASDIKIDDLQTIANLQDRSHRCFDATAYDAELTWGIMYGQSPSSDGYKWETVSFSSVRQLAKQELMRRELNT